VDFTSVTAALGGLKTATELAKLIKESDLSLDKAETKLKLAELIGALADVKLDVVNVQEKLSAAETQIKELEAELQVKGTIRWREPLYWLEGQAGTDGPFCQHCYDSGRKLVRLQGNGEGWYECKVCKNSYETKESRERDAAFQANAAAAFRRERGY
jgi:RNA-splicing ligase RtcB